MRILLRIPQNTIPPHPGQVIRWKGMLDSMESPTVEGAFDLRKWVSGQGCHSYGILEQWTAIESHWTWNLLVFNAREALRSLCFQKMHPQAAGIMVALLIGDKSGLDEDTSLDFRRTGLVHILTVSGFHIVFLSAFTQMLLSACRIPRMGSRILTLVLLAFFVPITGSSPSVERAVLMFGIVQVSSWLQRPSLSLHALGVACSLILLASPSSLTDIGFQLSCGATAGILLGQEYSKSLQKFRCPEKVKEWILAPSWICLCATMGTAPFLIYHFQSFSPIAFLGNLVIVPLMGLAMEAGVWMLVLQAIPWISDWMGQSASVLILGSTKLTGLIATLPGTLLVLGPWSLGTTLAVLGGGLALLKPGSPKVFPWIALIAWSCSAFPLDRHMTVWFLDAAQGDATLLRFPNHKTILIDAGNGEFKGSYGSRTLAPFFRRQGIRQLDALLLTHPDLDHYGGALSLIESFPVKEIWITEASRICDKKDWILFMEETRKQGIPIHTLRAGMSLQGIGDYHFTIHAAPAHFEGDDWNASSVIASLGIYDRELVLFMGDAGIAEEATFRSQSPWFSPEVLKLGHHGSHHSSSRDFLETIKPDMAVISCGKRNRYGHPSQKILNRLDSLGIPYRSTAREGSIRMDYFFRL